jgi:hypothetical protein
MRHVLVTAVLVLAAGPAAADPVVVTLREKASTRTSVVTIADVAAVTGGEPALRDGIAALDVAEIQAKTGSATVTRGTVEFRLKLVGLDPGVVTVGGAARTVVTQERRAVTADEVAAAARDELVRRLPWPAEQARVELTQRIVVAMPEVPAGEAVTITAQPHAPVTGPGRVQMDAVISAGGRRLLALPVYFEVGTGLTQIAPLQPVGTAAGAVPGPPPLPPPASTAPVVRVGERVTMVVRSGGLSVTAVGEAQQPGAVGQTVRVLNVDSRKVVTGRVSGPGTVDVSLGGVP